jgi:hypothetical protein
MLYVSFIHHLRCLGLPGRKNAGSPAPVLGSPDGFCGAN